MKHQIDGKIRGLILLALLSFGTEHQVRAYTDPGTGAMIWQTMIVALAGAMFYFRRFIRWVKGKRGPEQQ